MTLQIKAADAHSDLVVDILRRRQAGERQVFRRRHAAALKSWNVGFMMLATGGDGATQNIESDDPLYCTLLRIGALLDDIEECADSVSLCTATGDVERAIAEDRIAGMLMIEGAAPLRGSLECLDILYRLGIRSVQLTWNARNEVGDGCGEAITGGGLTRFGVRLVEALEKRGVLLDLSHASEALFQSVCEHARAPFIVSHANARAVCDHPRNLTDGQIKALAERAGVMGLCYFPWFVDPDKPSIDRLMDHLDHIVDLVGIDHVGIGADFIYYAPEIFSRELSAGDREGIYAKGFDVPDDLATPAGFGLLLERMRERGYAEKDIHKVFFANLMAIYKTTIG